MKLKKFDSINVIPFIDVLLVLLAIVLLTSTFIAKGAIAISLPNAQSGESLSKRELNITINEQGDIFHETLLVDIDRLKSLMKDRPKNTPIQIHTDKNARFEPFVHVLDLLKSNEFEEISIVTKK